MGHEIAEIVVSNCHTHMMFNKLFHTPNVQQVVFPMFTLARFPTGCSTYPRSTNEREYQGPRYFFSYSMGNEFVDTIYVHRFHTHICQSHAHTLLTRLSMGKVKSTTSPCFFYCFFSYVFLTSPHRESLFLFTFHISKKWQTCWQKQKWKSTHFFSLFIFIVVIRIKVFLFSLHET